MTPGTSEYSGSVYFDSNRNGNYEIFKISIRGDELQQVTFNPNSNDVSPDISASGEKIVFFSDRDGNYELYLMNADGSAQQRLTSNPADDLNPVFSPDGTKILFHANRAGNYDLYILDLNRQSGTLELYEVVAKIDEAIQGL
jgi:Tol biopolymer transport system component